MSARIRNYIRHNLLGLVAIFIALSGTAYAVDGPLPGQNQVGSEDIINNEVRSADLINGDGVRSVDVRDDTLAAGGLGAVDLAPDSVTGSEIAADSVGSSEVADNSLGAFDLAANSVTSTELAPNSVGTGTVANGSLTRDDIDEQTLLQMNANTQVHFCDPTSTTFINCGSVTLALPVTSDVLVTATGGFAGFGVGEDQGRCKLTRGTTDPSPRFSEQILLGTNGNEHPPDMVDGFGRTGVDQNVPAGNTSWNLRCNETNADARMYSVQLTALAMAN